MKYMSEYRDPELAKKYLEEIKNTVSRPWVSGLCDPAQPD